MRQISSAAVAAAPIVCGESLPAREILHLTAALSHDLILSVQLLSLTHTGYNRSTAHRLWHSAEPASASRGAERARPSQHLKS